MAADMLPVASPQAAHGRVVAGAGDSPGGLAATRAAGGLPLGLLVTIATPAGDNVIVAGTTSWHHRTRAMHSSMGGHCTTYPARPLTIVAGGPVGLGGDRDAGSRR